MVILKNIHVRPGERQMLRLLSIFACTVLLAANIFVRTPAADNAVVYFLSPAEGETVTNPVVIKFGVKKMSVAPAWVNADNTGHHHLLIDVELPALNLPIPANQQYRHYGQGETETELALAPGQHTLQLLMGDAAHIPHDPPVFSERITITVR